MYPIHLSIYPFIHLSIYPSIHLSIYLSIYFSVSLSTYTTLCWAETRIQHSFALRSSPNSQKHPPASRYRAHEPDLSSEAAPTALCYHLLHSTHIFHSMGPFKNTMPGYDCHRSQQTCLSSQTYTLLHVTTMRK